MPLRYADPVACVLCVGLELGRVDSEGVCGSSPVCTLSFEQPAVERLSRQQASAVNVRSGVNLMDNSLSDGCSGLGFKFDRKHYWKLLSIRY